MSRRAFPVWQVAARARDLDRFDHRACLRLEKAGYAVRNHPEGGAVVTRGVKGCDPQEAICEVTADLDACGFSVDVAWIV